MKQQGRRFQREAGGRGRLKNRPRSWEQVREAHHGQELLNVMQSGGLSQFTSTPATAPKLDPREASPKAASTVAVAVDAAGAQAAREPLGAKPWHAEPRGWQGPRAPLQSRPSGRPIHNRDLPLSFAQQS